MKNLCCFVILIASCAFAFADDRTVVAPRDDKPFTVSKSEVVRLIGKGIAGSSITINVTGPAKVETTNAVRELVNGQHIIGTVIKEFELKATDTGKVSVTISITPPQPGAATLMRKIDFEVK